MSSRAARKEQARARRVAQEQAAQVAEQRRRRLRLLAGAVGVAAVIVVVLVLVSQGGKENTTTSAAGGLTGVAETRAMFAGIAQDGTSLGDPSAPMVLTEFVDLQCPFCRQAALQVLPGVIERYVRPGRLRLELRTLRFIGKDSVRGAKAAQAAATRDRMWNFVDLWYRNQGQENVGYATDQFIRQIARGAGLEPRLALDGLKSLAMDSPVVQAERQATAAGISSTPSFLLGRQPGRGERLNTGELTFDAFRQALDRQLRL